MKCKKCNKELDLTKGGTVFYDLEIKESVAGEFCYFPYSKEKNIFCTLQCLFSYYITDTKSEEK